MSIPVLSLSDTGTSAYDDLFAGMPDNSIIDISIYQYEKEVDFPLGNGYAQRA